MWRRESKDFNISDSKFHWPGNQAKIEKKTTNKIPFRFIDEPNYNLKAAYKSDGRNWSSVIMVAKETCDDTEAPKRS